MITEYRNGLVSIIMPAFNCEKFISEAINSILFQSYDNWELIIINDNSTDRTGEIINEFAGNESRIKILNLENNSGAAIARNQGIDLANGKFIAFLDSDDIWYSNKLFNQIKFMSDNNFYFTCTAYSKINEDGELLGNTILSKSKSDYEHLLRECPGNSTVIYNAKVLGKFFIPNIKKRNDYVMWLQVIKKAKNLYGLSEVLSSHRVRKGSLSNEKSSLVRYHWRVYRNIESLPLTKSFYLVIYWILKSVFK